MGYSVILSSVAAGTLYSRSGKVINAPFGSGSGAGNATDANGNQITINGSGQFFDTLSATSPVLTAAGTAPSATTYTYTSPAGSKHYTMNYTQYNIATAFNCTGVGQYTGTAYLVSSIVLPDSTQYTLTYEPTTGRLKTLTLPTGGTITYAYTGGDGDGMVCADGSTSGLTRTLNPGGAWNYARSVSGSNWTTTVTTPPDPVNAGSASDVTTINFKKDGATNGSNYYETQRVVNQATSTVLATTISCYNGVNESAPSNCPTSGVTSPISRRATFTYLPNASGQQAETAINYLGGTDLPTDVYTYDFGNAVVGPLLRHTQTAYATLNNDIIDHPSSVKVFDGGGNLQAQTTYTYDEDINSLAASGATQHQGVTGSRGNLTTVATQANSTTTLYNKFTHYDTGMPVTSTDVSTSSTTNGATTTYSYASSATSCNFAFPTSIAEPLSLSRSMTWDCTGGVLLSTIDENSRTSSTAYSGSSYSNVFWRPYSATDQTGITTNFTYPSATQSESTLTFNGGASVVDHVTTLDGFGRLSVSQTLDGANYDSVKTTYDALGRATFVSLPYAAAKGALCSGCPGKTTGYDALGRVSSVSDSGGGSATYTYPGNDVYLTVAALSPENPKRRQFQYDGVGRLTSVCEITTPTNGGGQCTQTSGPPTGYWTKYAFNSLQAVVTQNAQSATHQTRTYNYDQRGRLVSEANPETKNVATNYTYDTDTTCTGGYPAGNLVKRIDAAGNVSCYTDDQLHRVTTIAYPSGPNSAATPTRHFVYDGVTITVNGTPTTMANAKTRLAEAYTGTSKTTDLAYSYSNRGEVTDVYSSTPSSGGYYHLAKAYWENGALKSLGGVPGVPTITYGVDGAGRISTASGGSQNPVTGTSYNPAGQVTAITFGSSDSDAYQYDANTNLMKQYSFNINGQSVIGKPTWNANGTLQQFQVTQDPFNPANVQTCSYGYDDLARISSTGCGSAWAQNFTFDPFGNITKSGSLSWMPGYDQTTNRYTLGGTAYDNNGNLTQDTFHAYQRDVEGHPVVFDSINSVFNAFGNLVEQDASTWNQEFIYDENSRQIGGAVGQSSGTARIPLPGGAQAIYGSGGSLVYAHVDWLGSERLLSNSNRTVNGDTAFAPFGETYANSNTPDPYHFAGYPLDFALGFFDTPFRDYHSNQGRWLTPDPAGLAAVDPTNPQTWNRYAYVANNPLSFIDPSGLNMQGPGGGTCNVSEYVCAGGGMDGLSGGGLGGGGFFELGYWPGDRGAWVTTGFLQFGNPGGDTGECSYILANPCSGPVDPSKKQRKSPARQQCEADANQKYGDQMTANPGIADRAALIGGGLVLGGSGTVGCVIGGAAGFTVGGPLGALAGCGFGALDAAGLSVPEAFLTAAVTQVVTLPIENYVAKSDLRSALAACTMKFPQ